MTDSNTCFVTGGAGFIGSNYIRHVLRDPAAFVVNVDKSTYAANPETVANLNETGRHRHIASDILNGSVLKAALNEFRPKSVVHFAAESHVDRSIETPETFVGTNILGTFRLLEAVRRYWSKLPPDRKEEFRFLHISTDEVYGSLGGEGRFRESDPYRPSTPYSATKAASNLLVQTWGKTYGLPVLSVNCSNNYGPYQMPEKLIPKTILAALSRGEINVHGRGEHVRDWLYVGDCCDGIETVLKRGRVGENYSLGGGCEMRTIEIVQKICDHIDHQFRREEKFSCWNKVRFIPDRPANDLRYALDTSKAERELGWRARTAFHLGLRKTVDWYLENRAWLEVASQRLGLS